MYYMPLHAGQDANAGPLQVPWQPASGPARLERDAQSRSDPGPARTGAWAVRWET